LGVICVLAQSVGPEYQLADTLAVCDDFKWGVKGAHCIQGAKDGNEFHDEGGFCLYLVTALNEDGNDVRTPGRVRVLKDNGCCSPDCCRICGTEDGVK
jgi:hypothetical protein